MEIQTLIEDVSSLPPINQSLWTKLNTYNTVTMRKGKTYDETRSVDLKTSETKFGSLLWKSI